MKLKLFALLALIFVQPTFASNSELLDFQNGLFQLSPTVKNLRWVHDKTYSLDYDSDAKALLASYLLEYGNQADRERAKATSLGCIFGEATTTATLIASENLCRMDGDYKDVALGVALSIMGSEFDSFITIKAMDILLRYGHGKYLLAAFDKAGEFFSYQQVELSLSVAETLLRYDPYPLSIEHLSLIYYNDVIDPYFRWWAHNIYSHACLAWGNSLF